VGDVVLVEQGRLVVQPGGALVRLGRMAMGRRVPPLRARFAFVLEAGPVSLSLRELTFLGGKASGAFVLGFSSVVRHIRDHDRKRTRRSLGASLAS
jgi:hypothetical protein